MPEKTTRVGQPEQASPGVAQPKILVIGLGNPILGDDGIGWHVAQAVRDRLNGSEDSLPGYPAFEEETNPGMFDHLEFEFLSLGGLALMERMVGYTHSLIIDAVTTNKHPVGDVFSFSIEDLWLSDTSHMASVHDTSLQNALQIGKMLGAELPTEITIIAVEAQEIFDFSETLSEAVSASIPAAVQLTIQHLSKWISSAQATVNFKRKNLISSEGAINDFPRKT